MAKGDPQIVPDMTLTGDAAEQQKVDYFLANCDDHAYMWDKYFVIDLIKYLNARNKTLLANPAVAISDRQLQTLLQYRELTEMMERRVQQMIGSRADDPAYYINACQQLLRSLEHGRTKIK